MSGENVAQKTKEEPLILDGHKLVHHLDRVKDWLAGKRIAPIPLGHGLDQGHAISVRLLLRSAAGKPKKGLDKRCHPPFS